MIGLFKPGYTLWRATRVSDEQGGWIETFVKVGDPVGRASPDRARNAALGDQERGRVMWTFACGSDVDIREGDQVRFGSRVLRVEAVAETSTGRRKESRCEETR